MISAPVVLRDDQDVPRHVSFQPSQSVAGLGSVSPQLAANELLDRDGALLDIEPSLLSSLDRAPSAIVEKELAALRPLGEKRVMDAIVVQYAQTYFGLPVIRAGVTVTLRDDPREIVGASSTIHHDIRVKRPSDAALRRATTFVSRRNGTMPRLDQLGLSSPGDGLAHRLKDAEVNAIRLVVLRYDAAARHGDPHERPVAEPIGLQPPELPALPLPPLHESIRDGEFRVALEVYFTGTAPQWGRLNWVTYIDVETESVLMLAALVANATAGVFTRDPITKGAGLAPSSTSAQLNPLRDSVTLAGLVAPVAGSQALSGEYVTIVDAVAPTVAVPTSVTPFNFTYDVRTNDFAAANTYYQCDRFFRLVSDLGFDLSTYFDGTLFPVVADHRGFLGNVINARCPGDAAGDGIGTVEFALADLGDTANPLGIAADWRVVLHELGGHGILWDHVKWANFGFAHSAGDSFAAILNDPGSGAPDRFSTFPWAGAFLDRHHGRTPADGWGWGGSEDVGGYSSEQILSTTLFRLYRSIGGDSPKVARRQFAARSAVYLILRAVGLLSPATNPPTAAQFETHMEDADAFDWNPTVPAATHAGGAYMKVIRWAFEKQGAFKAPGAPSTAEGAPPAVDVYIDDGRHGEYTFIANHWSCTDIWNRRTIGDGGGVHEEPVVDATNYAYVRIRNRGTQPATNVVVKGFHCLPGIGLVYPDDWEAMTTAQLSAPNLAAGDATGVVVGPFEWEPSQVGHECMFFSVSATGDAGNIDGRIAGSIPEWRLVPHDNNIGQRNVHPVAASLTKADLRSRRFWLRNPFDHTVRMSLEAELPALMRERGWRMDFASAGGAKFGMKPGAIKEIVPLLSGGERLDRDSLPSDPDERSIVITALADGIPLGGMTYVIDADYVDPNEGRCSSGRHGYETECRPADEADCD